jgi:tripartite-type tricarboxylate transporter receptor subunit TctC
VDAGKLRGIAVTGRERSPVLPNVPTLKETGYDGFETLSFAWECSRQQHRADCEEAEAELMRIAHSQT